MELLNNLIYALKYWIQTRFTKNNNDTSYTEYLKNPITHSFQFKPSDEDTTIKLIDSLHPTSSSGKMAYKKNIKTIKREICKPGNQSLLTSIFHDQLKTVQVLNFFLKGDTTIFDNYRSISVLPTISKLFEIILFDHIHEYFHTRKLYCSSQYGFRKKHSTVLATLEITDSIIQGLDKSFTPISIHLDLSKAFDTIDHKILIDKQKCYDIKA